MTTRTTRTLNRCTLRIWSRIASRIWSDNSPTSSAPGGESKQPAALGRTKESTSEPSKPSSKESRKPSGDEPGDANPVAHDRSAVGFPEQA